MIRTGARIVNNPKGMPIRGRVQGKVEKTKTQQQTYHRMLTDGGFATQADLARHLGVSRVWVSRVLKDIKKKTV